MVDTSSSIEEIPIVVSTRSSYRASTGISRSIGCVGTGWCGKRERFGRVVGGTGVVFDFKVKFLQAQPPPRQASLGVRQVHDPSEGMMVRSHGELVPLQIGP